MIKLSLFKNGLSQYEESCKQLPKQLDGVEMLYTDQMKIKP